MATRGRTRQDRSSLGLEVREGLEGGPELESRGQEAEWKRLTALTFPFYSLDLVCWHILILVLKQPGKLVNANIYSYQSLMKTRVGRNMSLNLNYNNKVVTVSKADLWQPNTEPISISIFWSRRKSTCPRAGRSKHDLIPFMIPLLIQLEIPLMIP